MKKPSLIWPKNLIFDQNDDNMETLGCWISEILANKGRFLNLGHFKNLGDFGGRSNMSKIGEIGTTEVYRMNYSK